jgi:hypothetical protein
MTRARVRDEGGPSERLAKIFGLAGLPQAVIEEGDKLAGGARTATVG